jgi:hypothetical protein
LFFKPNDLLLCLQYRGVEQLVARWAHNPKVTGSSPVPATESKGSLCTGLPYFLS